MSRSAGGHAVLATTSDEREAKRPRKESQDTDAQPDVNVSEDRIKEWLRSNGAVFDNITIGRGEHGERGTFASEDIPVSGLICRIPAKLMMTDARAAATTVGKLVQKQGASNSSALYVWLVAQRFCAGRGAEDIEGEPWDGMQPEGGWQPYIDVLPRTYEDPMWWSEEEKQSLLAGTPLMVTLQTRDSILRHDYDKLFPSLCESHADLFPADVFHWKNFLWAVCVHVCMFVCMYAFMDVCILCVCVCVCVCLSFACVCVRMYACM
jgi:hypothetical protein